jgi:large subunit ribosomal protein L31
MQNNIELFSKRKIDPIYFFIRLEYFIFAIRNIKTKIIMKKDIHPQNYRPVVFKDMSNDETFICRSAINAKETIEIDGVTYPLVKLEITSASHPFYTGKQKLVDTAGRVDKFMSRYGNRNKKK